MASILSRPQCVKPLMYKLKLCQHYPLIHWGQVMHTCIRKIIIIGSDNGLLPDWCQAIFWTNAGLLLIWLLGTNFSGILIKNHTFLFKEIIWKCCLENVCHFVLASMCYEFIYDLWNLPFWTRILIHEFVFRPNCLILAKVEHCHFGLVNWWICRTSTRQESN